MKKGLPSEWQPAGYVPVGGLTELGFGPGERQILVVSHSGRGLFETLTCARLARDAAAPTSNSSWLDAASSTVEGIGDLAGVRVQVVGLWGGRLPQSTADGWQVAVRASGTTQRVVLLREGSSDEWLIDEPITELRAAGFSNSGRFLLVATSSGLQLLQRADLIG